MKSHDCLCFKNQMKDIDGKWMERKKVKEKTRGNEFIVFWNAFVFMMDVGDDGRVIGKKINENVEMYFYIQIENT